MRKATILLAALGLAACGSDKKSTDNATHTDPNTTNPNATTGGTTNPNTAVNANDSNVTYNGPTVVRMGRMLANGNDYQFNWAGTTFSCRPKGTTVTLNVTAPSNKVSFSPVMDVIVDGNTTTSITLDGTQTAYSITLPDATNPHLVSFVLRTEANYGVGFLTFHGITTDGELLPTAAVPARQIEFIGDSITNGYGARSQLHDPVLGRDDGCNIGNGNTTADSSTESSNLAYSTLTAKALNAQYTLVASSGRGLYRNQGTSADATGLTTPSVPTLWKYTLHPYSDNQVAPANGNVAEVSGIAAYDDAAWSPQAVVINLGTNDYGDHGTTADPNANPFDATAYTAAMTNLLTAIHAKYPNAVIFPMVGPMLTVNQQTNIKAAITSAVTAAALPATAVAPTVAGGVQNVDTTSSTGCEYHPLPSEHEAMATILEQAIKAAIPSWAS